MCLVLPCLALCVFGCGGLSCCPWSPQIEYPSEMYPDPDSLPDFEPPAREGESIDQLTARQLPDPKWHTVCVVLVDVKCAHVCGSMLTPRVWCCQLTRQGVDGAQGELLILTQVIFRTNTSVPVPFIPRSIRPKMDENDW